MGTTVVGFLRFEVFFQREADSQRGGKIFNTCRNADTGAEQFVVAAYDSGAADLASVDERQQPKIFVLIQGQLIFRQGRKSSFAAEETFFVAAYAVAAAYIKSVRRRQIFTGAVLGVKPAS